MKDSKQFSRYELHFFGSGVKASPQVIISQDDNKEILGACTSSKTIEQLHQLGINISDSQVKLLKEWRLLKVQDGILQTQFPILSKDQICKLREKTKSIAPQVIKDIDQDFNKYLQVLGKYYPQYIYILVFSYVMDNLVWDCFEQEGLIPDRTIKDDLWVGVLWGSFLPRPFFLGTNQYSIKSGVINFVWNNDLLFKLKPFFLNPKNIPQMIKGFNLPVIHQQQGDQVYESSLKLVKSIARVVLKYLDLQVLTKQYGLPDDKQALVIVYHELMWDILEELEKMELLIRPKIITEPNKAKNSDLKGIIFLVD